MKIATWNVNSIIARLPLVVRWLEKESPDILCIQETKCSDEKFPPLELKAAGYDCLLFGQQSYNGSQSFRARVVPASLEAFPKTMRRVMRVCWRRTLPEFGHQRLRPQRPGGGRGQISIQTELDEASARVSGSELLIHNRKYCCAATLTWRRKNATSTTLCFGRTEFSSVSRKKRRLQQIKDWGFTDTFRLHTEAGGHYSWWDYRAGGFRRNLGLRIDHIWVSAPLATAQHEVLDR